MATWGGFTNDNVFNSWDLNPLAQQVGGGADGVRDSLANERDAFLKPKMQAYRQSGVKAAEDDFGLFNDEGFRSYVQSGQLPQNASPAQQWNAQPAQPQGQSQLMSLLMQRAQQGPVSATDPNVRAQVDPAVAQLTRQSRTYIDDAAERSGPLANIQGERRLASERTGQAAAQLEGEVLGRETEGRRQEISEALGMWGSLMNADQRMALERELAALSSRNQQSSLAQQNDQFMRELALRENNQANTWDYNWATLGI